MSESYPDRHALQHARHHRAIIDAAAALIAEREGTGFTVDELAERADVARRTIFNHFASTEDIVTTVCVEVLGGVVDQVAEATRDQPASDEEWAALDELRIALRQTDFVAPMAYLIRVLGTEEAGLSARGAVLLGRAFNDISIRVSDVLKERHPHADRLELDLLVASLMSGLIVINRHWVEQTGATDDAASRQRWAELLERMIHASVLSTSPFRTTPPTTKEP